MPISAFILPISHGREGTKGGIILQKLKKKGQEISMKLSVAWEGRTGDTLGKSGNWVPENGLRNCVKAVVFVCP